MGKMLPQKQAEEAIVSNFNETEHEGKEEEKTDQSMFSVKSLLWHGGSVYDAWFSCASNQVDQSIFGACCATTVFIPSFHNYRIWSFPGLGMTTYTACLAKPSNNNS